MALCPLLTEDVLGKLAQEVYDNAVLVKQRPTFMKNLKQLYLVVSETGCLYPYMYPAYCFDLSIPALNGAIEFSVNLLLFIPDFGWFYISISSV